MGTGQSKPKNKTGKAVALQKMETASKTGVLSLREHNLDMIPLKVFELLNLRTLDLSKNKLNVLSARLSTLTNLKSLNVENNCLHILHPITKLKNLQTLSAGKNNLGIAKKDLKNTHEQQQPLPSLPTSLKQIQLSANKFDSIPKQIMSNSLTKLIKLDLSYNNIASVPPLISTLSSLTELNLSHNLIPSLCPEISQLTNLKSLSLEYNAIQVSSMTMKWTDQNPQPLPKGLFDQTELIDLNLKGNKLSNTQLNEFDGFETFLERRQKLKSKNIYGGALTDLSVCGLE